MSARPDLFLSATTVLTDAGAAGGHSSGFPDQHSSGPALAWHPAPGCPLLATMGAGITLWMLRAAMDPAAPVMVSAGQPAGDARKHTYPETQHTQIICSPCRYSYSGLP